MFWSRKTKKVKLRESEERLKLFNETLGNEVEKEEYKDSLALYNAIKEYYKDKIARKEIIISVERVRLETITGKYNDLLSNYIITFFIGIMSALIALFIQGMGVFNISISAFPEVVNMLLKLVTFFIIIYTLVRLFDDSISVKNKRESIVNNIRLKVLEDIEKEIAEQKVKEKAENLEIQQRIEHYPNAQNEVAATSDRIIDNTENDKKTKGNGKNINGFINIIINRIYSK